MTKRTREEGSRLSAFAPQTPPRSQDSFNWKRRAIRSSLPFAIFSGPSLFFGNSRRCGGQYKRLLLPGRSRPSYTDDFQLTPAIRQQPCGSCTSCHVLGISVEEQEKMSAKLRPVVIRPSFARLSSERILTRGSPASRVMKNIEARASNQ